MRTSSLASLTLAASLAASLALVAAPRAARADSTTTSPSTSIWAGAGVELLPSGSLHGDTVNGTTNSFDAATAYGVSGVIEVATGSHLTFGLAPRFIFNVKGTTDTQSATQLDLRARVTAGTEVAPKVGVFGFVAPGYSIMFPPSPWPDGVSKPRGFVVDFGGGAAYRLTPSLAVTFEAGYQLGFQKISAAGQSASLADDYLHLGIGLITAI